MLVFHMEHMKEGETMTVYEMAKEDEYIHHAYNINQRLYKLKQSKKIDCRTARKLLQTINYNCKRYYSGDISPVDFLNILIDVESIRCELIGADIVFNELLHKLKIELNHELKFI